MRGEDSITYDAVLDLCNDHHRRIALTALADAQRSLTVNDLTKTIANHNHHVPVAEMSDERLSTLKTSLHHVHLPMIEASGLVEYDQEQELVEPTERFEQVQPTLSTILDGDSSLEAPMEL